MNTASSNWETAPMAYSTVESLLDEVSNHMAASNLSRPSRGSTAQKPGVSMRVVKPNSANNSPRNSSGLGRRMTDGAYRRRLAMLEQGSQGSAPFLQNDGGFQALSRPTARPVSWHPVSHHVPQTTPFQSTYHHPLSQPDTNHQLFDLQAVPTAYSGYNSPASAFSPYTGPLSNAYERPHYIAQTRPHTYNPYSTYEMSQQRDTTHHHTELFQSQFTPPNTDNMDPSMYSHFDWSTFAASSFEDSSTTPPTPENFLPIQHPEPTFPAEDSIPYHSLDDSDEGEELIGMGLYDTPEAKSPPSDPHLDNYRALMMSQLLGTPYRRPEPVGKGLKLEEGWNPPESDDGEGDDSDDDGDGEVEEEPIESGRADTSSGATVPSHALGGHFMPVPTQETYGVQNYHREGWM